MTSAPPLIEARRVSMSLPGVRALNEVDFDIHASEAHALIGEDPPANSPSSISTQATAQITGRGAVPR